MFFIVIFLFNIVGGMFVFMWFNIDSWGGWGVRLLWFIWRKIEGKLWREYGIVYWDYVLVFFFVD